MKPRGKHKDTNPAGPNMLFSGPSGVAEGNSRVEKEKVTNDRWGNI